MPTALRIGPYRFYFYSYDCREPRHMHVDRENRSVKFWLDPDVALAANHGYSRREVREIERMMRDYLETLRNEWEHSAVVTLTLPRVVSATVTDDTLSVDLEDGRTIAVPIGWYPRLAHGTPAERANFQISGAGYGIHWPELDEDIGVDGLLLGKKSTESGASFERWLQRRNAR
jgi:Protein of unknown function (DUF2442)/Domain of unknown function (DUF4160)